MAELIGTTYTLDQYDASPIAWTANISAVYIPGRTLPASSTGTVGLNVVPTSPPWPTNDAILHDGDAAGFVDFVSDPAHVTVATCRATDNPDGSGTSYDLAGSASPALATLFGVYGIVGSSAQPDLATLVGTIANPTDHALYLQEMTGTLVRFASIPHLQSAGPPPVNTPPTTPPPPSNLPPAVVQQKLLDAANPGFNCEIGREEHYEDLVTLFLGDKVNLTVNGVLGRLGIVSRAHILNRLRFQWRVVDSGGVPSVSLTTTATLSKVKGQLLPGAGTSNSGQDAAGDGAGINMFAGWDTAGGWDQAGWAA